MTASFGNSSYLQAGDYKNPYLTEREIGLNPIRSKLDVFLAFLTILLIQVRLEAQRNEKNSAEFVSYLEQKIAAGSPTSDTWRLLGRVREEQGSFELAKQAYEQSLLLQSDNAAAHFDLGNFKKRSGDPSFEFHFQRVLEFAPSSEYADKVRKLGEGGSPGPDKRSGTDLRAAHFTEDFLEGSSDSPFEILTLADELNRSDASVEKGLDAKIFVDFGTVFNTNIAVTPISRNIAQTGSSSFQAFVAPNIDLHLIRQDSHRFGTVSRGYFTLNEGSFEDLNLASFQPGLFFERDIELNDSSQTIRFEYVYSLDMLGGQRIGDRHALSVSSLQILSNLDVLYSFATLSNSDFNEDGLDPLVDSLDGPAVTLGISRFIQNELSWLPTASIGTEAEWAKTFGQDHRYFSISINGDLTFQLNPKLSLVPRAAVGYRHYPEFTGLTSRDETIIRLGGKLVRNISANTSMAFVFGHDRFASANADFDVEKTEAGIVFSFVR